MIKSKNIADLKDQLGVNNASFEVNYDKKHKDYVKITIGGKVSVINRDDLWHFIFSIVSAEKQQQMVPVKKQEFEQYIKQHTIELQKDMKKGETVVVHCHVNVRKEVADVVRREVEDEKLLTGLTVASTTPIIK